jgi:hypothetical protein
MDPIDPNKCKHFSVSKFTNPGISVAALRWKCNYCGKILYQIPKDSSVVPSIYIKPFPFSSQTIKEK